MKKLNLIGQKFGRLTVLSEAKTRKNWARFWRCKCVCGTEKEISQNKLRRGETKSCGCWAKDHPARFVHGMSHTREHGTWNRLRYRCYDKNDPKYYRYGARGIKVCDRWLGSNGFENFYCDMGDKPKGTSIGRINNNGDYEPSNCRWENAKQQAQNRSTSMIVTYSGKTCCLKEMCEYHGLKYKTIFARIRYNGWSTIEAIETPIGGRK